MKKIILLVVIAAIAWKLYGREHAPARAMLPLSNNTSLPSTIPELVATTEQHFSCDGRLHCSQMTSCAEATYFLKNCPGTKMDGDHDDIPCEKQLCR